MSESDFLLSHNFVTCVSHIQFSSSVSFANPEVEIWKVNTDGLEFINSSVPTDRNYRVFGRHMGFHAVEADFCLN